jgi:quinone-modifying oxidoreductase subunit QmoC
MDSLNIVNPDLEFIRQLKHMGGDSVKKCFQCAACSGVCSISPDEHPFPRKEMLWAQWGLKDHLLGSADIWLCHQCNDCSKHCPRESNPADLMAALRQYAIANYAFPRCLARAIRRCAISNLLPSLSHSFDLFNCCGLRVYSNGRGGGPVLGTD